MSDTTEINAACSGDVGATNACDGTTPKSAFGFLATFAVHLPQLMGRNTIHDVIPFVQYQNLRPNDEVGGGAAANDAKNYEALQIGAAYKPHPQVALKMAYRTNYYGGTEAAGAVAGDAGTSKQYFDLGVAYQY